MTSLSPTTLARSTSGKHFVVNALCRISGLRLVSYRGKPGEIKPAADLGSTLAVSSARLRETADSLGDSGLYDIFDRAEIVCRTYCKNAVSVCRIPRLSHFSGVGGSCGTAW